VWGHACRRFGGDDAFARAATPQPMYFPVRVHAPYAWPCRESRASPKSHNSHAHGPPFKRKTHAGIGVHARALAQSAATIAAAVRGARDAHPADRLDALREVRRVAEGWCPGAGDVLCFALRRF
jgi:hypothetical protein